MTNEQLLVESIVKVAFDDYKKAIKKGFIYPQDINIDILNPFCLHVPQNPSDEDMEHNLHTIRKPQNTDVECACNIIKDLTHSIVMYQYDIDLLERIFKKYDNDLRHWFIHYYGGSWVYPWDIIHNDMPEPIRSKTH